MHACNFLDNYVLYIRMQHAEEAKLIKKAQGNPEAHLTAFNLNKKTVVVWFANHVMYGVGINIYRNRDLSPSWLKNGLKKVKG